MQRLRELASEDSTKPVLRISINAGGCSGFQYNFDLVEAAEADDRYCSSTGASIPAFVETESHDSADARSLLKTTAPRTSFFRVFERDGVSVVTDEVSFSLLKGAKVDFEEDLIRSAFQVMRRRNDDPASHLLLEPAAQLPTRCRCSCYSSLCCADGCPCACVTCRCSTTLPRTPRAAAAAPLGQRCSRMASEEFFASDVIAAEQQAINL